MNLYYKKEQQKTDIDQLVQDAINELSESN